MSTDVESYRQALLAALRLRDVSGERIADALAEVDSHVEESGEDPEEAFGPPAEYAATLADALDPDRPHGWRAVLRSLRSWTVPGAGIGGFLLADGAFNAGAGSDGVFGLPAVGEVAAGIILVLAVAGWLRNNGTQVVDPRTGREVSLGSRWGEVAAYALPVVMVGLCYVGGRLLAA